MIKKEYYVISILIMVMVLIMFQSLGVATSLFQQEDQNVYTKQTTLYENSAMTNYEVTDQENIAIYDTNDSYIKDWAIENKMTYHMYENITDMLQSKAELLIIDPKELSQKDYDELYDLKLEGKVLVFTNLPAESYLKNDKVKALLGIEAYKGKKEIHYIKVYDGFFIGQETHYQEDVDLVIPYVTLKSGYKVFMDGYLDKEADIKNEEMPPIFWRSYVHEGLVYVMNNDFMEDNTIGRGILTGICNDYMPYHLYPVVNAKAMVLVNFPMISNENQEALEKRYSRSSISLMRDVVYPQLISIMDQIEMKGTFLFSSRLDYTQTTPIDEDALSFYMTHLNREGAEFGLSGIQRSSLSLKEKLSQDLNIFQKQYPHYAFHVFAAGTQTQAQLNALSNQFQDLKTFFVPDQFSERLFGFLDKKSLFIRSNWTMNQYTYIDDLKLKSLFTSLGMLNMTVDMKNLIYPESDKDDWTVLSKDMSRFASTYLKPYQSFDHTLLSETDQRIRRFLAMDMTHKRVDQSIEVSIKGFEEEAYFILNLHNETIEDCDHATFEEVDDGVYLIHAKEASFTIHVKEATS